MEPLLLGTDCVGLSGRRPTCGGQWRRVAASRGATSITSTSAWSTATWRGPSGNCRRPWRSCGQSRSGCLSAGCTEPAHSASPGKGPPPSPTTTPQHTPGLSAVPSLLALPEERPRMGPGGLRAETHGTRAEGIHGVPLCPGAAYLIPTGHQTPPL